MSERTVGVLGVVVVMLTVVVGLGVETGVVIFNHLSSDVKTAPSQPRDATGKDPLIEPPEREDYRNRNH